MTCLTLFFVAIVAEQNQASNFTGIFRYVRPWLRLSMSTLRSPRQLTLEEVSHPFKGSERPCA